MSHYTESLPNDSPNIVISSILHAPLKTIQYWTQRLFTTTLTDGPITVQLVVDGI